MITRGPLWYFTDTPAEEKYQYLIVKVEELERQVYAQ